MFLLTQLKIRSIVTQRKQSGQGIKIHAGCGGYCLKGWINIDNHKKSPAEIKLDLTRGFPLKDNTADFIFNEHFIEHLSYDDGLLFFRECFRVLKPGGVLRTAFPDLDTLIDSYQKNYWREMEWAKLSKGDKFPSGCYMLNHCIREKGHHQYMYTVDELKRRLVEAGFDSASLCRRDVYRSDYAELNGIERRKDSSVIEAQKKG